MIEFLIDNLTLDRAKENFIKLRDFLNRSPLANGGFELFEVTVFNASSSYRVYHRLGFVPKDILVTYVKSGTVTPLYSTATTEYVDFNVSSVGQFRVLIGRMQ